MSDKSVQTTGGASAGKLVSKQGRLAGLTRLGVWGAAWLRNPAQVGAVLPSSRFLGDCMARQVPEDPDGIVLEIGAGTGAITDSLVKRLRSPEKLVSVELSPLLAKSLAARLPDVRVLAIDVLNVRDYLEPGQKVAAIVSSLPLLSLPQEFTAALLPLCADLLRDGGPFIQFTYGPVRKTQHFFAPSFILQEKYSVWINVPPARVAVFRC